MKQKCDKTIVIKFFVVLFAIFFSFFANVFAQYYYFSDGWRTYQQWCSEVLEIRVNSNWQNVGAGRFHLVLDSWTTIYPQTNAVSELRSFFSASTQTFMQWTSEWSPSWKWSDYTILRADRNNGETYYNWSNKLYANVNFKPVFSGWLYDVVFGIEYISGDDTTETTLSFEWDEVINPVQQELYRTWTFVVLQEPCVADTKKPTVENISIKNNSTKVSYLSGLSFSLKDVWWSNWVSNVPYIRSGWEWTWNMWWTITNQYGIDETSLRVTINRTWRPEKVILFNSEWVSWTWNGKTRQDSWLNLDVSISSWWLFDFGIEKQVIITITVNDRAWNSSNLAGITFNKPKWPELIPNSVSPKNGDVYVNLSEPIKLWIQDDWAGVNSWTIKVTVLWINWTEYWPYTFSGIDLNLSWKQWSANEPDFYINITNHEKFPTSGTIKVEVYAEDMEWNIDNIGDYSFTTRPDCTDFQCCDPVRLDLWNEDDRYYYNTWLIISGWNNPTFSVDEENNTWVIDCNAESDWLSVYNWQDNFVFFTDESVLTILWTWVKWVLSWDLLTLSYIIEDSQVIIDKPTESESLSGWNVVDIQWHLTWAENQDDWLSGYVVEIVWDGFETWWFVDGTWITDTLPDWEYEIVIYPVDVLWNTWNTTTWSFVVDNTWPDFDFNNRSGYECEAWYLEITSVNDLLSSVSSLPYRFNWGSWTWNSRFDINSQNTTWFVLVTWFVQDSLWNISEKSATYEFIDTWISVNNSNISLPVLTWDYVTWIANIYESFGVTEWNCWTDNLSLEIDSCAGIGYEGNIVEWNLRITPNNYYEWNWECNLIITDDDWNHENVLLSFEIDTKLSSCALVILLTQQCTSWTIELLLTGDDDISEYRWNLGDEWLPFGSSIFTWVDWLWIYTWYVKDWNWNETECTWEVTQNIFDNNPFTVNVIQATWYECQTITWYVQAATWESCGKKNLSDFTYNWNDLGYSNNLSHGIYSGESWVQNVPVSVQDFVGNTGNVTVSYIWYDSEIQFTDIEIDSVWNGVQEFNWKDEADVRDWDCGSGTVKFNWFISTWSYWTCATGGWDTIIYTPNIGVQYEWSDTCRFEIRDDEWNTQTVTINLYWVDTQKPECSISYSDTVCTSGDVVLTMSAIGANEYSWTWFDDTVADNLPYSANWNWIYTWYVRDVAGNTWICIKQVETFDDVWPSITIPLVADLTAEECTLIQWVLTVTDNGGCGNWFNYSRVWFGGRNNANYSWYSEVVGWQTATVSVRDSAGNISNQTLNYTWTDTWVQLNNWDEKTVPAVVLTWWNSYNTTTWALISLFWASEWNCGSKYISVEKVSCDWLSMDIDEEWNVVFTWNSGLSGTESCTLKFSDNDWNSENWMLNIMVDTVVPWITLEWTNVACMSTNTFDVTWIFTEPVVWFDGADIDVDGWSVSSFAWNGAIYTWKINMTPMVITTVSVPAGVVTDLNGTENIASTNELTWMYDNVWPNAVNLVEKATVYSDSTSFSWSYATDSGCADVSWYQRELYLWECSWSPINSWYTSYGTENTEVSGLEDTKTYCRRVRPIDNFWNTWGWASDSFDVDLSSIWCHFVFDANCTNWTLQVTLRSDKDYTANGDVYLSWQEAWDWKHVASLSTWVTFSGQVLTWYIYQPNTAKSHSCVFVADTIDNENPEIVSVNVVPVPECTTLTAEITEISDEWCGSWAYTYNWNWEWYWNNISFLQYFGTSGTRNIDLRVKDNVWNESDLTWIVFMWTNSDITANDFTWSTNVWNSEKTANWRILSEAVDGVCGSGSANVMWSGFISTWEKWECTRSWDNNITYTSKPNQTWDDMCEIQLKDDEDSTVNVKIYWEWIDTVAPTCSIAKEPETCLSWSVLLTLTANETLSQVLWWDIVWWISENTATWSVNWNWEYVVQITDLAWNIWSCSETINYINTWVLDKPTISIQNNLWYTNDNTLDISWSSVSANWCRYASWYEVQIISGWVEIPWWITNSNSWTSPELLDGEYTIKVRTLDNLWWESEWEEFNIHIDTVKPTCTIEYNDACTGWKVQLSMMAPEANYYSWTGFGDVSDFHEVISVDTNWIYYCYVQDLAWNTWSHSIDLVNISVLPLSAPNGLTVVWWTPINNNTPAFEWTMPMNDWCREVSNIEIQILLWSDVIDSDEVNWTWWTSGPLDDWEYTIRIRTQDNLGWVSEWNDLSFVVDTTAPICSVEVVTQECTYSDVEIKLSWDVSDIVNYSWWNWISWPFWNDITILVGENGNYAWYVYDAAWNQWECTWVVWTWIQDQTEILYNKQNATWYECELITWSILWVVTDTCGKDDLNKFTYVRDGWANSSENWILVNSVSWFDVNVIITDWAWNTTWASVHYAWQDAGVTLVSGENQNIWSITWNYSITTWNLIDLFDAEEWACGKSQVTVSWRDCSWATMSIDGWNIIIEPDSNLDWVDGYCRFEFGDDEKDETVVWTLKFVVDTVVPELDLTWNAICAKWWTPWTITGKWSENVEWFELSDIDVINWTRGNNRISSEDPIYVWPVTSPTEWVWTTIVLVLSGKVVDGAWNTNVEDKSISWEFDNVWPDDVDFDGWQDTIFTTETTLNWNTTTDSGCSEVLGYNYKFIEWWSCDNGGNIEFTTNSSISVDSLVHGNHYTLCVQPVDNLWNVWNWTFATFEVDLNSIWCVIEESACSSTWVTLSLKPWEWVEWEVLLSWDWYYNVQPATTLTKTVTTPWLVVTWYIQQNSWEILQWRCSLVVQNIDQIDPTMISVVEAIWYECETITWSIELWDDWCGQWEYTYSWAWWLPISNNWYSERESSPVVTLFYVTWYDKVLNSVSTWIKFQRLNSPIQANDFTWSVSVWNSIKQVNWKIWSNASDGVCGSGTLEDPWVQSQWEHGTCVVDWDTVSYEPNTDEQYQWDDSCVIRLMDDEWSTFDITVNWWWVDTEKPSCTLNIWEWQSCTSWKIVLSLSSESNDVVWYSFDWENRASWTSVVTMLTSATWAYNWYVKDSVWNVSEACTVEVTWWILDLDNPTLNVSSWTWYECSTWSITVTWNDNSCGINWLYYGWEWFDNTTNINEIYSWNVWSHTVNVSVFDWAWHSITKEVTYIWQNVPVTWSWFTVENVGTWITVDWFLSWNVSAWSCEEADIEATSSNTSMCEISGHNIIYKPIEWVQWEESCIITITDWDEEWSGDIDIEITFTWVDTKEPTVVLQWWVGESCIDINTFLVTWTFSEDVVWVSTETLKWENVQINNVEKIDWKTYQWTVEMNWWTWKVRINSWEVTDLIWNENEWTWELILGNYDLSAPDPVDLKKPSQWEPSYSNTIDFEWTESVDQWCAGGISYILQVCTDELCNQVIRSWSISWTWMTEWSLPNGTWYWRVISMDANGNTWVSEIRNFVINSNNPNCWIEEKPVCTDRNVRLTMTWDKNMTVVDGWWVVWSWYWMIYTWEASRNWKIVVVVSDTVGRTWQCSVMVSQHDETWPEIIESIRNVYECNSLNINIVAQDTWCAWIREYMFWDDFGQWAWQVSNSLSISMSKIWRNWWVEKQQVISVKDTLWNETLRTWKIIVDDVQPTLWNWDYDLWTITWEVVDIDVIDVLWANEWNCGIWDLQVQLLWCTNGTWELIGWVLSIEPVDWIEWDWECELSIEDNEENSVTWYIYYFVDTKEPVCTWWYADPSWWTSWDSVMVYLTWCSESLSDNMWHEFTSNTWYNFIFTDNNGNTWSLFVEYTWFDREAPIFELYSGSIDECQTWIVIISGAVDTGIWLADDLPYSFDWINRSTGNEMQIYSNVATWVAVSGYAIDWLWNQSETGIIIYIEDSKPSVTWFTVSALNWIDVDWKELSNATDWACGSGTMYATVTWGTIGTCTISGNILSYKPNDDYVTWSDACELTIYDDEWNFVTGVNAEFTDVNKYPYVKLISPNNWDIQRPWRIVFSWTGMWDETAISGYVYRIWNTVYDKTWELTGFEISVELGDGAYNWYVYAIFADWTTWWLSNTSSFNIIPASSWWWGWWWGKLTKDRCPNWDLSDSYYDWTCSANWWTHWSAITDICWVNESIYSTEQKFAYLYSYTNWITTICPIQDANVDWYLIRSHFAKMISEFAVNVVWFKPKKWKTWCDKFDDIDTLNKELHDFAVISCELSLMWLESDGVTPSKSFNPNDRVTRAQFGTVLSRLLFGGMYNVKNESNVNGGKSSWYKAHLQALKNYWIMTKIDWDWPNYYERRGRVMIMLQRADNYWIFAWRIPAKNGVKALFD